VRNTPEEPDVVLARVVVVTLTVVALIVVVGFVDAVAVRVFVVLVGAAAVLPQVSATAMVGVAVGVRLCALGLRWTSQR
jgi:hypothetical protein